MPIAPFSPPISRRSLPPTVVIAISDTRTRDEVTTVAAALEIDAVTATPALALEQILADSPAASVLVTDRLDMPDNYKGLIEVIKVSAQEGAKGPGLLSLPAQTQLLLDRLRSCFSQSQVSAIAVAGAVGGAGATVVACALSIKSSKTVPTVLMDCSRSGRSCGLHLGIDSKTGLSTEDIAGGAHSSASDVRAEAVFDRDTLWRSLPHVSRNLALLGARSDPSPSVSPYTVVALARTFGAKKDSVFVDCGTESSLPYVVGAPTCVVVTRSTVMGAHGVVSMVDTLRDAGVRPLVVIRTRRGDCVNPLDVAKVIPDIPTWVVHSHNSVQRQCDIAGLTRPPKRLAAVIAGIATNIARSDGRAS